MNKAILIVCMLACLCLSVFSKGQQDALTLTYKGKTYTLKDLTDVYVGSHENAGIINNKLGSKGLCTFCSGGVIWDVAVLNEQLGEAYQAIIEDPKCRLLFREYLAALDPPADSGQKKVSPFNSLMTGPADDLNYIVDILKREEVNSYSLISIGSHNPSLFLEIDEKDYRAAMTAIKGDTKARAIYRNYLRRIDDRPDPDAQRIVDTLVALAKEFEDGVDFARDAAKFKRIGDALLKMNDVRTDSIVKAMATLTASKDDYENIFDIYNLGIAYLLLTFETTKSDTEALSSLWMVYGVGEDGNVTFVKDPWVYEKGLPQLKVFLPFVEGRPHDDLNLVYNKVFSRLKRRHFEGGG